MVVERRDFRRIDGVEINLWNCAESSERFFHCGRENLPNRQFVLKFDFCFCGVYIYVNTFWIYGEIQEVVGLFIVGDKFAVARNDSLVEIRMAHKSAVHKKELQKVALSCAFRLAYETGDTHK